MLFWLGVFVFYALLRREVYMRSLKLFKHYRNEHGATLVEYALLAALLTVALISAVTALATNVSNTFSSVGSGVQVGTNDTIHPNEPF